MTQSPFPDDVTARVRSYLTGQAEVKDFARLTRSIEDSRAALLAEVEGLSAAQAAFKPQGDGEAGWCVLEVLRHVVHEEYERADQIEVLALGRARTVEGPKLGVLGALGARAGSDLAGLVRDLAGARQALLARVGAIAGSERLDTTSLHPWFGDLNCRGWFLFQGLHDGDHMRQIQAIKTAPTFPA
jgi:hypothetical protein